MTKPCILALALALASSRLFAAPDFESRLPERLLPQLEALLQQALSDSDQALERSLLDEESLGRRVVSDASVLPTLGATLEYREEKLLSDQPNGDERQQRLIYNVSLSHPLYHWGARSAQKRIGRLDYDAAMADSTSTRRAIVNFTRRSYMDLLVAKQDRALRLDSLERKRAELKVQCERAQSGRASESSVEALERNLERVELDFERSEIGYQNRLHDVASYLNIAESDLLKRLDASVPAVELVTSEEISALRSQISESIENGEDLRRIRSVAAADREALTIANAGLKPKLNAILGLSQNGIDVDGVRREEETLYAGLKVNWDIFDGFATSGRRQQAIAKIHRSEMSLANARVALERSLQNELRSLELTGQSMAIEERDLAMKESDLTTAKANFEKGQIAEDRLEEIRAGLARARISAQSARANYIMQICSVAARLGLDTRLLDLAAE